jgi:hypothetical protein
VKVYSSQQLCSALALSLFLSVFFFFLPTLLAEGIVFLFTKLKRSYLTGAKCYRGIKSHRKKMSCEALVCPLPGGEKLWAFFMPFGPIKPTGDRGERVGEGAAGWS